MAATCPRCISTNLRRTAPGALLDDYTCRDCGHVFERVAPTIKRMAIITCVSLLTLGLDGGAIGAAIASSHGDHPDGSDD